MNGGRQTIKKLRNLPFDKLRANGLNRRFPKKYFEPDPISWSPLLSGLGFVNDLLHSFP
jgi:hypothetical protein